MASKNKSKRTSKPTYTGAPAGSGKNFKALSADIQKDGKSKEQADAISASIGIKKYGKKGMAKMAKAGRKGK